MGTASAPHGYQRGSERLHSMKTAKSDFFSKKSCLYIHVFLRRKPEGKTIVFAQDRCRATVPRHPSTRIRGYDGFGTFVRLNRTLPIFPSPSPRRGWQKPEHCPQS